MSGSCPACANDGRRTSHSGADIDFIGEAIPGGESIWKATDRQWPSVELVRCGKCRQLWTARHDFPDRPPYACSLDTTREDAGRLAMAGGVEGFIGLTRLGYPYDSRLPGLPLGVALRADKATREAMRNHPEFPEGFAFHWDRLVGWGTL